MATTPRSAETATCQEETHDEWIIRHVEKGLAVADSPDAVWVSHEEVRRDWEEQREEVLAMIANK